MINGVVKTPLKQIHDERGKIMHMLRSSDPHFKKFGEVYFSWIYAGAIKAWSKHLEMEINYAVPIGSVKVVLYDDRSESSTFGEVNEFFMNSEDYYLLTIPNRVWYGFKSMGNQSAMIVNCSTIQHDPKEIIKMDAFDPLIPYDWKTKNA